MNGKFFIRGIFASSSVIALLAALPAQAGFEWKPAPQAARPAQPGAPLPSTGIAVMPDSVSSGPLTPMPDESGRIPIQPLNEADIDDMTRLPAPGAKPTASNTMRSIGVGNAAKPANTGIATPRAVVQPKADAGQPGEMTLPPRGEMAAPGQAMPVTDMQQASPPAAAPPARQALPPVSAPVKALPATVTPVPPASAPTPIKAAVKDDGIVQGFGKNIPLAFALRQIVPHDYNFSFGPGVDQGKPVSWSGGREWKAVMDTTLSTIGYRSDVKAGTISILSTPVPAPAVPATKVADAKMSAPQVVDLSSKQLWKASKNDDLKTVVSAWAETAHAELVWKADPSLKIPGEFKYDGAFDKAVDKLLAGRFGNQKPKATLYPNLPNGPSVLVVN